MILKNLIKKLIHVMNDKEKGLEAYRIFEETNGRIYGNLERYVNCKKQCNKQKRKKFTHRTDLKYGMLYCPDVDMIVDELEKIKINIKINELTIIREESGSRLKSLREMTKEEREEYFSLQDQYDNFYSENVKFVEKGKEKEYLSNLNKVLKGD